ncbi:PRC1 family protein [Megaselia abdita]
MSDFTVEKLRIQHEVENITHEIGNLWGAMFPREICQDNYNALLEHTKEFFNDLLVETSEKKEAIEAEIDSFYDEADNLKRLLQVDIHLQLPNSDATLYETRNFLDDSLKGLRERLQKRKDQIVELLLQQESLCEELGELPKPLTDDPLPSEDELQDFSLHLNSLQGLKVNRKHEISQIRKEIKNFLQALELTSLTKDQEILLNTREIPLTLKIIESLKEIHSEFMNQCEDMRSSIDKMREKLYSLWNRLEVEQEVRNKFAKYYDYTQTTYIRLYEELDRCEALKRQNIRRFVDQLREEIVIMWDKTLKSDKERSRFTNFTNDCYTDDLLALHEMELEDLKKHYSSNENIYTLLAERSVMWERMEALEKKASEPGRYNNRGGQLLKEEKERKSISSKLPKIEEAIKKLVQKYEDEHHRKFTIYGLGVNEMLESEWEQKKAEKEKVQSARKLGGVTPNGKTIVPRTPMSARNASTLKKTASTTNLSTAVPRSTGAKRKLTTSNENITVAKKSLMSSYTPQRSTIAPPSKLKPKSAMKTPFKSPKQQLRPRVLATTINNRSSRKSGNYKKRKSAGKSTPVRKFTPSKIKVPKIVFTTSDTEDAETDSYDTFQEYIQKEPASRSSIMPSNSKKKGGKGKTLNSTQIRELKEINLPDPRSNIGRSPGLSRTAMTSASPLPSSSRKLTTKNLPILI